MNPETRIGLSAAIGAYLIWGLLPLYFKLVGFASAFEVLAQRIVWGAPCAAIAVFIMRAGPDTRAALAYPAVWRALLLSSALIAINWGVYVWAVGQDRVIESSLAYFMSPLVNVALGVFFFSERLSPLQIVALALAVIGVVAQGVSLGAVPWVALILCATWAGYSLVRKQVNIPATGGLLVETMLLAAPAAITLFYLSQQAPLAFSSSPAHAGLLMLMGPATAAPMILFAIGARRLSFSTLGILQYMAPSLQFLIGVAYGEPLTPLRVGSFAFIWAALIVFTFDALRRERQRLALSS